MKLDRIELSRNWLFALTDDENAVLADYDDSAFSCVTIPHDWQIGAERSPDAPGGGCQGFFCRERRGVYRLSFDAPMAWKGKEIRILFEGVQRFSTVYLNGCAVGGRPYGYVPFACDITQHVRLGERNLLAVSVDNRNIENHRFGGGDRWYSGAGIHRQVFLLVDEPVHIVHDGISIRTEPVIKGPSGDVPDVAGIRCDQALITVSAEVTGNVQGHMLQAQVFDDEGRQAAFFEMPAKSLSTFSLDITKPCLWSPENPKLYTLKLQIDGQAPHQVRFGVRSAVFDGEDGFLLNGVKTKLWGVNVHHDGGAFGSAVPEKIWKRRLEAFKRLGANTIRCAHHPMPEYFYDLCDEMGFLVMDEIYDKWSQSGMYFDRFFDEWCLKDTEAMVRRDRTHPSIILWSVGNEVGHQYSELFYCCLKKLCDHVRAVDPTRALTAALIGFVLPQANDLTPMSRKLDMVMRYAEIVDVFTGNYMEHFYEKMREYGMRKPIIGSEVRTYYRLDEKALNSVQLSKKSPYEIVRKHDWVCGALIWAGIDYLGESSFWPMKGWSGNLLYSTADWKLRAWYTASQFRTDPVLKLAVYDENEPWDGARGAWGFPQMRSHWKYHTVEKMLHVVAMTNCDTVRFYQNSQTVRVAKLEDFPDGMIHMHIPFIPGILRAEGYRGGLKVCEDVLHSDHEAESLKVIADCRELPADGQSVALIDLLLEDRYGRRYMLEDRKVQVKCIGAGVRIFMDSGNVMETEGYERTVARMDHGHMMIAVQAGGEKGKTQIIIRVEGFRERRVTLTLQ